MELKNLVTAPFKFTAVPVSVLALIIYGLVFTSVLVTDETPDVPLDLKGLSLNTAYNDLHRIAARPHPYSSHANDEVHTYLLGRLNPIVAASDYISLSEDVTANATYFTTRGGTYFEGTNILVKVDGTDAPNLKPDGVVFSAHYDSVSTAPGATDNGMAVATLLQLVQYLADPKRRPRRTAVFLFNNGEEDGLNGVHMFFEHPWSNLTTTFINLEGAAAGGRPILFRSTSLAAARSFSADGVPHPHGNVLSADAFARGVIRSITDYTVFEKGIEGEKDGMQGIDFAFYKNRAYYHTLFDSIPGMGRNEGRKALWSLMETVRGAGMALLNDEVTGGDAPGVYFDILGHAMITFSMQALFTTHVVILILGPLVVLGLLAWLILFTKQQAQSHSEEEMSLWTRFRRTVSMIIGWGRFWLSFLITIACHVGLVFGYVKINPFVAYSRPYVVLTTTLTLSFLALVTSLSLFAKIWPSPPSSQKFAIILETYLLSWIFLVVGTVGLNNLQIGGVYLLTVWNICAWLAAVVGLLEAIVRAGKQGTVSTGGDLDIIGEPVPTRREEAGHRFVSGVRYNALLQSNGRGEPDEETEPEETEPTEITPLMQQQRRRSVGGREYIVGVDNRGLLVDASKGIRPQYEESGWWILQMLLLIPGPALLLTQIDLVLMHALRNTMADGSPPAVVYGGLSLMSLFIFINITPFAHNIHKGLILSVLSIFIITLTMAWTAFPFVQEAPLKIFFQQSVELASSAPIGSLAVNPNVNAFNAPAIIADGVVSAVTILTGLRGYTDKMIIPDLPSSWGKNVSCKVDDVLRPGLWSCGWESDLLPSTGKQTQQTTDRWLSLQARRTNETSARFTLRGENTRSCKLYFKHPITSFEVVGSGGRQQPGYEVPDGGVNNIALWSRTWGKEFIVDVGWVGAGPDFQMAGAAACEWTEYASSTAGSPHADSSAQIPALEEVLQFFPLWATPTKWTLGLVEGWTKFSV